MVVSRNGSKLSDLIIFHAVNSNSRTLDLLNPFKNINLFRKDS